jgi:hypothetical protein
VLRVIWIAPLLPMGFHTARQIHRRAPTPVLDTIEIYLNAVTAAYVSDGGDGDPTSDRRERERAMGFAPAP